ncbi:hypothetical protein GN956_G24096 [Arapaima gigas]
MSVRRELRFPGGSAAGRNRTELTSCCVLNPPVSQHSVFPPCFLGDSATSCSVSTLFCAGQVRLSNRLIQRFKRRPPHTTVVVAASRVADKEDGLCIPL